MTELTFTNPVDDVRSADHHGEAADLNARVVDEASGELLNALAGKSETERILLKAAAGAGKSYAIKQLVADAVGSPRCLRVGVTAFQNRQLHPLADGLADLIEPASVCLFVAKNRVEDVPDSLMKKVSIATKSGEIPTDVQVVVATSHKLGSRGERGRLEARLGYGANGEALFDVLFVDEAWQLPEHLFHPLKRYAPLIVAVGDVGQLPPLEVGPNPWRGDPGHNPKRAWPTAYDNDPATWSRELPSVWRPTFRQLALWRAFYPEWARLLCVPGPNDRRISLGEMSDTATKIWKQVASGVPTLLEVDGLDEAEAADIDVPLVAFLEGLLDELFGAGFTLQSARYDEEASPTGETDEFAPGGDCPDQLVTILATRNQAVNDAEDAVARLHEKYDLTKRDLCASTVDSWQGQTNGITVAIHPLSGATQLDDFNSAFGRLAVTCTRATHGLLVVSRPGLAELLANAPARPGTPFGEPGNRQLPRQTHERILATFARGTLACRPVEQREETECPG